MPLFILAYQMRSWSKLSNLNTLAMTVDVFTTTRQSLIPTMVSTSRSSCQRMDIATTAVQETSPALEMLTSSSQI